MTLEEFRNTARPVNDRVYEILQDDRGKACPPRDTVLMFGPEGTETVLYIEAGHFWPIAWWYRETPRATWEEATEVLFDWHREFV